jgi:AcrR family transcriptional regulator
LGVAAADLNEIAAELETSARMLIHHFGSKDDLIAAAVTEARERQRRLFESWFDDDARAADLPALLRSLFELIQSAEAQPYLRLFSEVYSIALHQPDRFPGCSTAAAVHDRLPRLRKGLRDEADLAAVATPVLAFSAVCCSTCSAAVRSRGCRRPVKPSCSALRGDTPAVSPCRRGTAAAAADR